MNLSLERQHKKLLLLILNCLSFCSIIATISILVPSFIIGGVPLVIGFLLISTFHFIKAEIRNKHAESFDLTLPTSFDTEFLIFNSQKEKCALFFTISFSPDEFEKEWVKRTLAILFKILPEGAVFSTEWSSIGRCYATFYIKFEKVSVLDQARELVNNIKTSFESMFGANRISLLNEKELVQHLALGIPGCIREAVVKDKYRLLIKTDQSKRIVSMIRLDSHSKEDITSIASTIKEIVKECRIIISFRRWNSRLRMSPIMILLYTYEKEKDSFCNTQLCTENTHWIQAIDWIHDIGNTLIRNFYDSNEDPISFEIAVEKMLSIFTTYSLLTGTPQQIEKPKLSSSILINPQTWRRYLISVSRRLEIKLELDVVISIKGLPIRMDGRIKNVLFKVLSSQHQKQLDWLSSQINHLIQTKQSMEIVFLISNPTIHSIVQEKIGRSTQRITFITSLNELKKFLLERENAIPEIITTTTNAA